MKWYNFKSIPLFFLLILINSIFINSFIFSTLLFILLIRKIIYLYLINSQMNVSFSEFQNGLVYAPISGEVDEVRDDDRGNVIVCKGSSLIPSGICFPVGGEIISSTTNNQMADFFSFGKFEEIGIKKADFNLKLIIKMHKFQNFSKILRIGDMGISGALFSELPFMAKVEIILPKYFKVNVNVGEKVLLGKTPLASWE